MQTVSNERVKNNSRANQNGAAFVTAAPVSAAKVASGGIHTTRDASRLVSACIRDALNGNMKVSDANMAIRGVGTLVSTKYLEIQFNNGAPVQLVEEEEHDSREARRKVLLDELAKLS